MKNIRKNMNIIHKNYKNRYNMKKWIIIFTNKFTLVYNIVLNTYLINSMPRYTKLNINLINFLHYLLGNKFVNFIICFEYVVLIT